MRLRNAVVVARWQAALRTSQYVGVVMLTRSTSWGRSGARGRILREADATASDVDVRFGVPRWLRLAAELVGLPQLSPLFRAGPLLLVYGNDSAAWLRVMQRAEQVMDGATVIGAKIGDEAAVREGTVRTLRSLPDTLAEVVPLLEAPARGLAQALDGVGVAVVHSVQRVGGDGMGTMRDAPSASVAETV
ncbi:hypothetical protein CDCA_CDCA20G4845 [Cyanidium caldarium]|uniref:50S ribosomal protein L10 n=1 Tax=Cyanidium caldarium TaxID=2771 RepID=A0AAV9J2N8_CYACA|nr:hypothetical protein CDCA_CDCA20G4845 [Cyanidium caldarium]